MSSGPDLDPLREVREVLDDLETWLKNGDVVEALTRGGVNASIALLVAGGLRAYVAGEKEHAAEDFATAAEEIRARMQAPGGAPGPAGDGASESGSNGAERGSS